MSLHFETTKKPKPCDGYRGALAARGEAANYEIECDQAGGWGVVATAHDGLWCRATVTLDYAILLCRLTDRHDHFGPEWQALGNG